MTQKPRIRKLELNIKPKKKKDLPKKAKSDVDDSKEEDKNEK